MITEQGWWEPQGHRAEKQELEATSKGVCTEHSISRVAMASGAGIEELRRSLVTRQSRNGKVGDGQPSGFLAAGRQVLGAPGRAQPVGQVPRRVSQQGWHRREEQLLRCWRKAGPHGAAAKPQMHSRKGKKPVLLEPADGI